MRTSVPLRIEMTENPRYPLLANNDKELLTELFSMLTDRVKASAYEEDGSYATAIKSLPIGLRAMAATHHLDVSLTLDDIGWHFLNFGEAGLVRETEAGLRQLGLADLAEWFIEAHRIVEPFLKAVASGTIKSPGDEYYNWLEQSGNRPRMDVLCQFAWDKSKGCSADADGSAIYESWIKFARSKPEDVFNRAA
jgi:hypothetical protein